MTIKLEVGKKYELNNGEVHECTFVDTDWAHVIHGWGYHSNGVLIGFGGNHPLSVRREATPKTWGEMTDAEKGALLLARHEDKAIDIYKNGWVRCNTPLWYDYCAYRIKPEPVRRTVTLQNDDFKVTFETVGGEPHWETLKGEVI